MGQTPDRSVTSTTTPVLLVVPWVAFCFIVCYSLRYSTWFFKFLILVFPLLCLHMSPAFCHGLLGKPWWPLCPPCCLHFSSCNDISLMRIMWHIAIIFLFFLLQLFISEIQDPQVPWYCLILLASLSLSPSLLTHLNSLSSPVTVTYFHFPKYIMNFLLSHSYFLSLDSSCI